VFEGIDEVIELSKIKNAALQYMSQKMTPNNFTGLQHTFKELDQVNCGFLPNDAFVKCLSKSNMKVTEREVQILVNELDTKKTGKVNYDHFLKYSYLSVMYINHFKLEFALNERDVSKKGLVTVS